MTQQAFLILTGVLLAGATLAFLGWRGRRINRVPACRDCGFDLSGVLPNGVTCPECGAGLRRPKAVRNGQRKRLKTAIALGILLMIGSSSILGLGFFAATTNTNLDAFKPLELLAFELRYGGQSMVESAATEIKRRYDAGLLSASEQSEVIDLALDVQANRDGAWSGLLGDMIESNWPAGLSKPQQDRYLRQMIDVHVATRSRVRMEGGVPILIALSDLRAGTDATYNGFLRLDHASIGGKEVTATRNRWPSGYPLSIPLHQSPGFADFRPPAEAEWTEGPRDEGWQVSFFQLDAKTPEFREVIELRTPEGQQAGDQPIQLNVRLGGGRSYATAAAPGFGLPLLSISASTPPYYFGPEQEISLEARAEFIRGQPTVVLQPPSPELDTRMVEAIELSLGGFAGTSWNGDGSGVSLSIRLDSPPFAFAHEAILQVDGVEFPIGTLVSESMWEVPTGTGSRAATTPQVSIQKDLVSNIPRFVGAGYKLVLRPNVDLAERSLTLTRIYAGELEMDITSFLFGDSSSPERNAVTRTDANP